jgi:hypothetical protein
MFQESMDKPSLGSFARFGLDFADREPPDGETERMRLAADMVVGEQAEAMQWRNKLQVRRSYCTQLNPKTTLHLQLRS